MKFNIECNGDIGTITLGDFTESYGILLGYWTAEDYRKCWFTEISCLVNTRNTCCLTTWMPNPQASGAYKGWLGYKHGQMVVFTERIWIGGKSLPKLRSDSSIIVRYRKQFNGISSWNVPLKDIEIWLTNQ